MPKLISEVEVKLEWADILNRTPKKRTKSADKRSSGVHLSGVLREPLRALGVNIQDQDPDEMPICVASGMAWEDWAVGLYKDLVWQPGEVELDGVIGNPDGLSFEADMAHRDGGYLIVEEFKVTWMSRHRHGDVVQERKWMWQVGGYCKMMQCNYARLHVLWVNGDYRPPKPQYFTYLLRFEQDELDKFWRNVVLKNRDKAVREEHE